MRTVDVWHLARGRRFSSLRKKVEKKGVRNQINLVPDTFFLSQEIDDAPTRHGEQVEGEDFVAQGMPHRRENLLGAIVWPIV